MSQGYPLRWDTWHNFITKISCICALKWGHLADQDWSIIFGPTLVTAVKANLIVSWICCFNVCIPDWRSMGTRLSHSYIERYIVIGCRWFLGPLVNTPLDVPLVVSEEWRNDSVYRERLWGAYRSNVYFGMRPRLPQWVVTWGAYFYQLPHSFPLLDFTFNFNVLCSLTFLVIHLLSTVPLPPLPPPLPPSLPPSRTGVNRSAWFWFLTVWSGFKSIWPGFKPIQPGSGFKPFGLVSNPFRAWF